MKKKISKKKKNEEETKYVFIILKSHIFSQAIILKWNEWIYMKYLPKNVTLKVQIRNFL